MANSGMSHSRSESESRSPTIKDRLARNSDNTTLVSSPDDAGRLASAKTIVHHTMPLSSSSLSQLRLPVKRNHKSSIDRQSGAHQAEMDFDEDDYESSIESSLRSASQMSFSVFSCESDNIIRRIEQLDKKLEAVTSSHEMLRFKAQARLKTHGVGSSQYKNYSQTIEEKRMEIVSITQRIEYKRSLLHAEDNPTTHSSKTVACHLLHLRDDRADIPSGIFDNRGQLFRDNSISVAGQKRFATSLGREVSPTR